MSMTYWCPNTHSPTNPASDCPFCLGSGLAFTPGAFVHTPALPGSKTVREAAADLIENTRGMWEPDKVARIAIGYTPRTDKADQYDIWHIRYTETLSISDAHIEPITSIVSWADLVLAAALLRLDLVAVN